VNERVTNYPRWIADLCAPYLGAHVLEVGAGYGTVTQYFVVGRRVVAVDSSAACAATLRGRFSGLPNVEVSHVELHDYRSQEPFDSVVMINTLEHIPDDVAALRAMRQVLRPGGRAIVYVPAFNALFSEFDRKVGHQRRYNRRMMAASMEEAGLSPIVLRYVNLLGLPAWLVFSRLLRREPSDERAAEFWDRTGTVASRWIEMRVRVPIGLNILAVGQA
jgi:SAM-dependent methyltransferase